MGIIAMNTFKFSSIPLPLEWQTAPEEWYVEHDDTLIITADRRTDLFSNPTGDTPINNSPKALFTPQGDVMLSAKIEVDFVSTFDAGVLLAYNSDVSWAKLCFEFSPQKQPMVVSVVNKGVSDDCNSVVIDGNRVYLRIAKISQTFAFHYSLDGTFWHMVRYFTLESSPNLRLGFSTQSPTGEGCTAKFSQVVYVAETLKDIRSGK
jgi:regulation of enolase protein 1 (concanavalin A-like superfamily)